MHCHDFHVSFSPLSEQKLNDDMNVASINDTVKIMKSQLCERDSEIVQLGTVIKKKEEDLAKASSSIQEIIGASATCEAEKLQLRDQLDSLTIVAENLESLQHQIRLKDNEIDQLKGELESLRDQLEALRSEHQQNRPPPDITQYQANRQPDIATFQSQMQPDLMPGIGFQQQQASPFDLVQNQGGNVENPGKLSLAIKEIQIRRQIYIQYVCEKINPFFSVRKDFGFVYPSIRQFLPLLN